MNRFGSLRSLSMNCILVLILISTSPSKAESSWGISGLTGISYGNVRIGLTEAASFGLSTLVLNDPKCTNQDRLKLLSIALSATSVICNNIAYKYSFGDQPIIKFFGKVGFWSTAKIALIANLVLAANVVK
ncbi:MAG: hypothetical protein P4L22_00120 [Candidatus Babeliales bacterium]|nr:hypothetical protein [Candidatus Babeliales bacterium]